MTITKADIPVVLNGQIIDDGFSQTAKLETDITNKAQKRIESMTVAELSALVKISEGKQMPKEPSYREPPQDTSADLQELLIRLRQSALPLMRKQIYKELAKQSSQQIKQNSNSDKRSLILLLLLLTFLVIGSIVGLLLGTDVLQLALSGIVDIAVQTYDYLVSIGRYIKIVGFLLAFVIVCGFLVIWDLQSGGHL
jgi:hypothetical protein